MPPSPSATSCDAPSRSVFKRYVLEHDFYHQYTMKTRICQSFLCLWPLRYDGAQPERVKGIYRKKWGQAWRCNKTAIIRFVPKEPQKPEPDKLHAIDRHWAYSTIPVPLWQTA